MIYPKNFETRIGFDKIREMLLSLCYSSLGKRHIEAIRFSNHAGDIAELLSQTSEFKQIIFKGLAFPGSNYHDLTWLLEELKTPETYAGPDTLIELSQSYATILNILVFTGTKNEEGQPVYPFLHALGCHLQTLPDLPGWIDAVVDEKALVRDSASTELSRIRKDIKSLEVKAEKRIQAILREGKAKGWIDQDSELALRNGRQVIPVIPSRKRDIQGFVHDRSATGQTLFIEPEEVFGINNQIRELEIDEEREMIRILRALADNIRPHMPLLLESYDFLGMIDAIRAKARLSIEMEAGQPDIADSPVIDWIQARHPLLYMAYKPQRKHVEPMSLSLDTENRILVVSGPNAGGKSVALKTCGLVQYMLQCGLPVPMAEHSRAGVFERIFIDIGDQQSIENDLSTYSSHLLNMKFFLHNSNEKTLFLIDEMGSGTEPRVGGAIAEAVLNGLNQKKAFGLVTTHYANLKLMAGQSEGIVNGSMLFDSKNMKPLFRLKTGAPGSSFAFEIAGKTGLPENILDHAASLAGDKTIDFDIQLQDMEIKKLELEEKEKQLRGAEAFLSEMIDKYQHLSSDLENRKSEILIEARRQAKEILSGTNQLIENTIRQIRESQADKQRTLEAREQLQDELRQHHKALEADQKKKKKPKLPAEVRVLPGIPASGNAVRIIGQANIGEVISVSGQQALVSFGMMQMRAPLSRLEIVDKKHITRSLSGTTSKQPRFDLNEKAVAFSPVLDLRGSRAEEALRKLGVYLDDAILLSIGQVKILHGKGDGILRMAIRDALAKRKEVKRYSDDHPDRGGAGATIIDLK